MTAQMIETINALAALSVLTPELAPAIIARMNEPAPTQRAKAIARLFSDTPSMCFRKCPPIVCDRHFGHSN